VRNVGPSQACRQLFAAKTEPVDPVRRHRVEVGRIGVSLLAAHKVGRRIWQGFIELTKIGKNEVLDLPGAPRLVQSVSRCIYTRYADDISFSSYQPLTPLFEGPPPPAGNFSPDLLKDRLRGAFRSNGFAINPQKVHYADKHSRRTVTGLKINELVNVDRKFVRNIRAALFVVEKQGAAVAQKALKDKYGREASIASHLRGRISWVCSMASR